ncbi:hypothetical protein KIN20_000468 [Parelaphostrongylus tenuis]|uniref:Uncharacterized protein n=1 Tax=Parelaphostrongylus tenuis TaxID=148309 RepID=A0AAD5LUS5_PARTN|nr:hypothetical protein KIN20_000468 [Parelaphostrongylus tenuis]
MVLWSIHPTLFQPFKKLELGYLHNIMENLSDLPIRRFRREKSLIAAEATYKTSEGNTSVEEE